MAEVRPLRGFGMAQVLGTHSRTATAQPTDLTVLCDERDALYHGKGLIAGEPSH
jgi:hypothetical protein